MVWEFVLLFSCLPQNKEQDKKLRSICSIFKVYLPLDSVIYASSSCRELESQELWPALASAPEWPEVLSPALLGSQRPPQPEGGSHWSSPLLSLHCLSVALAVPIPNQLLSALNESPKVQVVRFCEIPKLIT